ITTHGKDGAYQKLTHYGNEFMHDDELTWAACEMFLATGENAFHQKLKEWLNPADPRTRRWGWWRLWEGYGCAIRGYAFAARSGRLKREELDPRYLSRCEEEIVKCAEVQWRCAQDSAYGTSFPVESKRFRSAAWYFSLDRAFDLAAAFALDHPALNDPRPKFLEAIVSNLNYEGGCNPVNVCYVTGLGWKRQREIVHQFATNDRRVLPPSGLPLGNVQAGFGWLELYKRELGALTFPPDGARDSPYPFYDRWGDSFNVNAEFVIVNQGRALATLALLMTQTPLTNQPWRAADARIEVQSPGGTATLKASGLDLHAARIVWEAENSEPRFGETFSFNPTNHAPQWIEAEAQWPDGHRVFAVTNFSAESQPHHDASSRTPSAK
ncbi:MAG TPA: glycoside hydrolase family 9 protein, partial [Verrucomicrobiae bacterium]|nr:glycoside hydrolase family 9 protein [Verrucomicrobiae bacterium]